MSSGKLRNRAERKTLEVEYCSWGKHYQYPVRKFAQGSMCLDCQMQIAEGVAERLDWPELSMVTMTHVRNRRDQAKVKRDTTSVIRGDSDASGFVYYIRINGQIKIGYSANVTDRMRHYPPGSELLAIEPGTLLTEKERHQDFCRYLVRGREWFAESDVLAAHIEKLREELGDPSALAYEFTKRHA